MTTTKRSLAAAISSLLSGSGCLFRASPYGGTGGPAAKGGVRVPPRLNRPLRLRRREKSERSIDLEEVTWETGVK